MGKPFSVKMCVTSYHGLLDKMTDIWSWIHQNLQTVIYLQVGYELLDWLMQKSQVLGPNTMKQIFM